MPVTTPEFLKDWLERPIACSCGGRHDRGVRRVVVGAGTLEAADAILDEAGRREPLLLLADPDTWEAAGVSVAMAFASSGRAFTRAITGRAPHADDAELERLRPALSRGPRRIVAVGAGTIGDLGKALAAEAAVPLMTVGTAASMNGYASSIAALTIGGLKVTRPAPCPDVLLFDTKVLTAAPAALRSAGFGDLASKPVSGADWVLSHRLLGEPLCPAALSMTDAAASRARAASAEIGAGDPAAIATLVEALVLSGLSMTIAGASSPASGGEHLLSHYLDISSGAGAWQRDPRLHGEQVAVGTLASLALYRRVRAAGPAAAREARGGGGGAGDETNEVLAQLHAHLPETARAAVLREAEKKRSRAPGRAARLETLERDWDAIWTALDAQLAGADGLEADLRRAGAPTRFPEIGVGRERAEALLLRARHMRDRYTVLDLASDLGMLPRWAGEIAEELS